MYENGSRLRLEHFLAPVLLIFLFAYAYFNVFIDISPLIFWALWAMITCVVVLGVLRSRSYIEQFLILTILLMSAIVIRNPASFWPFQINGVDDYFEVGLARTIMEVGRWNPEAGLGFATNYYGYFPGVHVLLASLSLVIGTDPFLVGKFVYLPTLILVLFAFAYSVTRLCCRRIADSGFVGIAMLFYASALGILSIHISRRTFGDVFLMMIFYMLARQTIDGKKSNTTPVLLLSAAGLAIGHHFPQYYILMIGLVFVLFLWRSKLSFGSVARWFLVVFTLDTSWEIFVAPGVMDYDIRGYLSSILNFLGGLLGGTGLGTYGKPTTTGYSLPETLFPYASQSGLILLCMIGLIILLTKNIRLEIKESPSFTVMKFVTVFGLLVYVGTGPLILTQYFFIPFSTSDFSTIGLSILFCIGLLRLFKKTPSRETGLSSEDPHWSITRTFGGATLVRRRVLVMVLLLLVISSGNLLIAFSARHLDRTASQVTTLEDARNFRHEDLSAGAWLESNLGTNKSNGIEGDYVTWLVFSGYLSLDSSYDYSMFNNTQTFVQYGQYYIVVVDSRLALYTSDEEPSLFPSPTVNQVNFAPINRLYSNGLLSITIIGPK
jgi:hypothetical protein